VISDVDAARKQFEKVSALLPNDLASQPISRLLTPGNDDATNDKASLPPGP